MLPTFRKLLGRIRLQTEFKEPLFRLGVERLEDRDAPAAHLVADINTGSSNRSTNVSEAVAIGDTLYFNGSTLDFNTELYRTDGTAAGTSLVKDIYPGSNASTPTDLTAVNGVLYFSANDGVHGRELWRSDGTEAGTYLLKEIVAGSSGGDFGFSEFRNVNGTLFFTVKPGGGNCELWKSDGTTDGTVRVSVLGLQFPMSVTTFGDKLVFVNDDGIHGFEPWISDGTEAGTAIITDLYPGPGSPYVVKTFVNLNGQIYFAGANGTTSGLFRTDGTSDGTVYVGSPGGDNLQNVDGTLYFSTGDRQLWKCDAAGSISLVKDFGSDVFLNSFRTLNGKLIFRARNTNWIWTRMALPPTLTCSWRLT